MNATVDSASLLSCPVPAPDNACVTMAHGGGGRLTEELLAGVFRPAFANDLLNSRHDGAVFKPEAERLAMSTDSYVVNPLVFPGGTIGSLAVNGTVNDLAMCGARPLYLSAGFVIEEGLPMALLRHIVQSMAEAAALAGVRIVTGDTKVVDRGKADGLFINTSGVGRVIATAPVDAREMRAGDAILLSGDVGRHGMAIMAVREGLEFESDIETDCAPLNRIVDDLFDAGIRAHCLRDLTRGGLATALVEVAEVGSCRLLVEEEAVPVSAEVMGACEILGLDPLYVANEGRFICICPETDANQALEIMRRHETSAAATRIGRVVSADHGGVVLNSRIGAHRVLDLLSGEQLPRIC